MKKLLLSGIALAAALSAGAAHLGPDDALRNALASDVMKVKGLQSAYALSYTAARDGAYAFNNADGGFIVVSAESDDVAPLLGYSANGRIDAENMAPAMKWWLDLLAVSPRRVTVTSRASRAEIKPMLKTEWGQDKPYNQLCPKQSLKLTPTGCMATAAAQIMKYWNYPAKGTGSVTYTWNDGKKDLSFDFDKTPFEWDLMLDNYTAPGVNATKEQINAVATLMYGVGCAFRMQYNYAGSGADDFVSAAGLINNLNYDKSLIVANRDTYELDEWITLIYDELAKGHPILYTGTGAVGGHAFVCDGYLGSGNAEMFHINWGWDGMSDGYFQLNALSPDLLGTGGGGGDFNYVQSAFINMMPARPGSDYIPYFIAMGRFAPGRASYSRSSAVTLQPINTSPIYYSKGVANFSPIDFTINLGVKLTSGNEVKYIEDSEPVTIPSTYMASFVRVSGVDFPTSGTWNVGLAVKYNGKWYDVRNELINYNSITAECSADKITFTTTDMSQTIEVSSFKANDGVIYTDGPSTFSYTITAKNAPYSDTLIPVLVKSSSIYAQGQPKQIDLATDETKTVEWNTVFMTSDGKQIAAGSYSICLLNPGGFIMSSMSKITATSRNAIETVSVDDIEGDATYYDLNGVKVANPVSGGVYIMTRPLRPAVKVVIR